MRLQTEVTFPPLTNKIDYSSKIFSIGSCFATEIGSWLREMRFEIVVNPFGVLFNPASIARALERIAEGRQFVEEDLFLQRDIYKSFELGSNFGELSKELLLTKANSALMEAKAHFESSHFIIITLGTSWIYRELEGGEVVANCHKERSDKFVREMIDGEKSASTLSPIMERYPDKEWIISVSPVRHFKDGARANQLSKAHLLVATELLEQEHSRLHYFPAYEIFMDQLRDYRFYAADMLHPSEEAINYIRSRFRDYAISKESEKRMAIIEKINRMRGHRALFPESKEYQKFQEKILYLESLLV